MRIRHAHGGFRTDVKIVVKFSYLSKNKSTNFFFVLYKMLLLYDMKFQVNLVNFYQYLSRKIIVRKPADNQFTSLYPYLYYKFESNFVCLSVTQSGPNC